MGSFVPRSTRNRWAWGLAWLNLLLLLVWNFLPNYRYRYVHGTEQLEWVATGILFKELWPSAFDTLIRAFTLPLRTSRSIEIIATLSLIFMTLLQFCLVPIWRLIASSKLMRFIPAGICVIGFFIFCYYFTNVWQVKDQHMSFRIYLLSLISLNFLLSIIILLLYRPESNEVQPITES